MFAVIMLIWNRIVRRDKVRFARFGRSRASASSSFSGSVGFSNFVRSQGPGIAQPLARACSANTGFSGLPGFSVWYYVALMDVKSEATLRRRVKRCTDENPSLFVSLVTWLSKLRCVNSYYLSLFPLFFVQTKRISVRKLVGNNPQRKTTWLNKFTLFYSY